MQPDIEFIAHYYFVVLAYRFACVISGYGVAATECLQWANGVHGSTQGGQLLFFVV